MKKTQKPCAGPSVVILGWRITPEIGIGSGPDYSPIQGYCVVGPRVRSETRVCASSLGDVLPGCVYKAFSVYESLSGAGAIDDSFSANDIAEIVIDALTRAHGVRP